MSNVRSSRLKVRTEGLSRRAYARQRNVSERTIRDHLASGLLKPALLPDGSLDATKADELLGSGITRGQAGGSVDLTEARRQKLRAQIRLIDDEVQARSSNLVTAADAAQILRDSSLDIVRGLRPLLALGPDLAGLDTAVISTKFMDAICAVLAAVSGSAGTSPAKKSAPDPQPIALDDLDLVELASLKTQLEAKRLDLVRAEARRDMLTISEVIEPYATRLSNVRAALLAMPSRHVPHLQYDTPASATETIRRALVEVLTDLAGEEVTVDELVAELMGPRPGAVLRDHEERPAPPLETLSRTRQHQHPPGSGN